MHLKLLTVVSLAALAAGPALAQRSDAFSAFGAAEAARQAPQLATAPQLGARVDSPALSALSAAPQQSGLKNLEAVGNVPAPGSQTGGFAAAPDATFAVSGFSTQGNGQGQGATPPARSVADGPRPVLMLGADLSATGLSAVSGQSASGLTLGR